MPGGGESSDDVDSAFSRHLLRQLLSYPDSELSKLPPTPPVDSPAACPPTFKFLLHKLLPPPAPLEPEGPLPPPPPPPSPPPPPPPPPSKMKARSTTFRIPIPRNLPPGPWEPLETSTPPPPGSEEPLPPPPTSKAKASSTTVRIPIPERLPRGPWEHLETSPPPPLPPPIVDFRKRQQYEDPGDRNAALGCASQNHRRQQLLNGFFPNQMHYYRYPYKMNPRYSINAEISANGRAGYSNHESVANPRIDRWPHDQRDGHCAPTEYNRMSSAHAARHQYKMKHMNLGAFSNTLCWKPKNNEQGQSQGSAEKKMSKLEWVPVIRRQAEKLNLEQRDESQQGVKDEDELQTISVNGLDQIECAAVCKPHIEKLAVESPDDFEDGSSSEVEPEKEKVGELSSEGDARQEDGFSSQQTDSMTLHGYPSRKEVKESAEKKMPKLEWVPVIRRQAEKLNLEERDESQQGVKDEDELQTISVNGLDQIECAAVCKPHIEELAVESPDDFEDGSPSEVEPEKEKVGELSCEGDARQEDGFSSQQTDSMTLHGYPSQKEVKESAEKKMPKLEWVPVIRRQAEKLNLEERDESQQGVTDEDELQTISVNGLDQIECAAVCKPHIEELAVESPDDFEDGSSSEVEPEKEKVGELSCEGDARQEDGFSSQQTDSMTLHGYPSQKEVKVYPQALFEGSAEKKPPKLEWVPVIRRQAEKLNLEERGESQQGVKDEDELQTISVNGLDQIECAAVCNPHIEDLAVESPDDFEDGSSSEVEPEKEKVGELSCEGDARQEDSFSSQQTDSMTLHGYPSQKEVKVYPQALFEGSAEKKMSKLEWVPVIRRRAEKLNREERDESWQGVKDDDELQTVSVNCLDQIECAAVCKLHIEELAVESPDDFEDGSASEVEPEKEKVGELSSEGDARQEDVFSSQQTDSMTLHGYPSQKEVKIYPQALFKGSAEKKMSKLEWVPVIRRQAEKFNPEQRDESQQGVEDDDELQTVSVNGLDQIECAAVCKLHIKELAVESPDDFEGGSPSEMGGLSSEGDARRGWLFQ